MEANNLTNTNPILYLGRDRVDGAYYFLGGKDGVGRFLKFQVYPMWIYSNMIGNFLDIGAEVPTEVLAEVMLFVNGVVNYELLPAKQGRAETVIRTELETGITTRSTTKNRKVKESTAGESSSESNTDDKNGQPCEKDSGSRGSEKSFEWPFPNFGFNDPRRGNIGSPPVDEPLEERVVNRRKRSSGSPAVLGNDRNSTVKSEASIVQAVPNSDSKPLGSENGELPVKRKRGRPAKVRTPD